MPDSENSTATIRILATGDCVGRPGRRVLREAIPILREEKAVDLVIANAENAVNGWGLTPKAATQILEDGADVLTSGDHILDRREIDSLLESDPRVLRPINYKDMPGAGTVVIDGPGGVRVGVANIVGRTFFKNDTGNPLELADQAVEAMGDATIKLLDVHAEATSEKVAVGWYLDGRVSAVWGTHTHVQTADETVLPEGTGYITDLGFVGAHKSVLGRKVDRVLNKMLDRKPLYMDVAREWLQLDGTIFEIDVESGRCVGVERVRFRIDD